MSKEGLEKVKKAFRLFIHLVSFIDHKVLHHKLVLRLHLLQITIVDFELLPCLPQDHVKLLHEPVKWLLGPCNLGICGSCLPKLCLQVLGLGLEILNVSLFDVDVPVHRLGSLTEISIFIRNLLANQL